MTREEYDRRRVRFEVDPSITLEYYQRQSFPVNTVFEVNYFNRGVGFAKVGAEFAQIFFDIIECTSSGKVIKGGLRSGSVKKSEIAERLHEGDWRIYSKPY